MIVPFNNAITPTQRQPMPSQADLLMAAAEMHSMGRLIEAVPVMVANAAVSKAPPAVAGTAKG